MRSPSAMERSTEALLDSGAASLDASYCSSTGQASASCCSSIGPASANCFLNTTGPILTNCCSASNRCAFIGHNLCLSTVTVNCCSPNGTLVKNRCQSALPAVGNHCSSTGLAAAICCASNAATAAKFCSNAVNFCDGQVAQFSQAAESCKSDIQIASERYQVKEEIVPVKCYSTSSKMARSTELLQYDQEELDDEDDERAGKEVLDRWNEDLAAIRKLLESESGGSVCPSCEMPFDKGKKRKLIDSCGHERCYSCMFRNEGCPLCLTQEQVAYRTPVTGFQMSPSRPIQSAHSASHMAEHTQAPPLTKLQMRSADKSPSRTQVMTNGHFTSYMQNRQEPANAGGTQSVRPPRCRPPIAPNHHSTTNHHPTTNHHQVQTTESPANAANGEMTHSCPTPPQTRRRFLQMRSPFAQRTSKIHSEQNAFSDDEGGNIKPPVLDTKCAKEDMYLRIGLLLGEGRRSRKQSSTAATNSHESCSSLASYDNHTVASNNTSPVSTLTGSSEADVHSVVARLKDTTDSIGSLMSMSGHSTGSASPVSRRHSVTTTQPGNVEELNMFKNRRTSIRRSARAVHMKGPIDPKIRFAQYLAHQLTLKPLFFEVPLQEPDPLFMGREWLVKDIEKSLSSNVQGALISGSPGTGKTAIVLQLVEKSCFGRRADPAIAIENDSMRKLAACIVAYHFCQADNNSTCLVPDFIHSIAAQLCQAPQLVAYRELLLSEPHLQTSVSIKECVADSDLALKRGILEPLTGLRRSGKIGSENCIILVDALCESEYHRPDNGDTIASFLAKHTADFPPWLKVIATVRTELQDFTKQLPYTRISLDKLASDENLQKDLTEYITFRVQNSPCIRNNLATISGKADGCSSSQYRFCQYLVGLSRGSFLFTKLTLDLIERGYLVTKSSSFKVLPVTLAQIFQLHFNLRFPTVHAFEKVSHILSVCLVALYPLTLLEIFYSVNALLVDQFLQWDEFVQRFKLLSGFLVKRLDNTYMFFHPSFREWLMRRDENESLKFLCDLRAGHAAIAFRLSRVQGPLDAEQTLELGHHILKAHVYRNMTIAGTTSRDLQAQWVANASSNVSAAMCTLRNIYSPNVKVSRLFLLAGASPNHSTEFLGDAPALCMFAHEGIVPMVSLLLEFGANVELSNSQGCTALIMASARGHCDVVRQLVAAGSSLGHADASGQCALVHAARNGSLNVVGYLLACDWIRKHDDSDVELLEAAQQALVAASAQGHTEIVEYLLDMSEVNADKADVLTGETALTVAAGHGCFQVVSALIVRGATIDAVNKKGASPLQQAVKEGHWATTKRLMSAQADLDQTDHYGKTALMIAASEGHIGLIELLLDKGASLKVQDREGLTALSWACLRGRLQSAQCLLDRGDDINHSDLTGRTPLDLAAFQGNPGLVQMLLDRGAIIEHVDVHGMRPLDRAIGCRNLQAVQCFLRKGAKLGPATWAMAAGKPEIMLNLLNKLLEDGNVLYRKNRLQEASHRYQYALKKLPNPQTVPEHIITFTQLKVNLLLNQSRCKRKMNENEEAIKLATDALTLCPQSFEAFYARCKALLATGQLEMAFADSTQALQCGPHSADIDRVLTKLNNDIQQLMSNCSEPVVSGKVVKHRVTVHQELGMSSDNLADC